MQTRYIVTLLILCAGLALSSDQVGAAKKATPKPPKSSLAAPVKPLAGNAYEAVLARPVPFKKVYKAAGLSWTCFKSNCTAHGAAPRPTPAQCRGLEKQAGKLKSCGRKGRPRAVLAPGKIRKTPDSADKTPTAKLAPGRIRRTPGAAGKKPKPAPSATGTGKAPGMVRTPGPVKSTKSGAVAPGKPGAVTPKKPGGPMDPASVRPPGLPGDSGIVRSPASPSRSVVIRAMPITVAGTHDPESPAGVTGNNVIIRALPIVVAGTHDPASPAGRAGSEVTIRALPIVVTGSH